MGKKNKKLSPATEAVLDLAFLENDIELMTKEYLLVSRDLSNRVLPTRAYPNRWRTIHRKMKILNDDLKEKSYYVEEDGIHLKESYEIENERRAYLRYILIRPPRNWKLRLSVSWNGIILKPLIRRKKSRNWMRSPYVWRRFSSKGKLRNVPTFYIFPRS